MCSLLVGLKEDRSQEYFSECFSAWPSYSGNLQPLSLMSPKARRNPPPSEEQDLRLERRGAGPKTLASATPRPSNTPAQFRAGDVPPYTKSPY